MNVICYVMFVSGEGVADVGGTIYNPLPVQNHELVSFRTIFCTMAEYEKIPKVFCNSFKYSQAFYGWIQTKTSSFLASDLTFSQVSLKFVGTYLRYSVI